LAVNTTPFQAFTSKNPDLWVWGCRCFPAIPPELHTKAGPRRYKAIFIGYEEAHVGWLVRNLKGKVNLSRADPTLSTTHCLLDFKTFKAKRLTVLTSSVCFASSRGRALYIEVDDYNL
jgi:hypothetical protein